jgi:kynurenine formamidase
MCSHTLVSEQERRDIAAYAAEFGKATASPFGPDDEIGMLNLMDANSMARVLAEADAARVFDLSVDYFLGMPSATYNGDPPFQIWMSHTPGGTVIDDATGVGRDLNEIGGYSGDCISMYTHCGTHIDTLNHFGYHGQVWNGYTEDKHLGSRHWTKAGADTHPPIIARGVLVDVAAAVGVSVLPSSFGIGETQLKEALARQGTTVQRGDVVLVRTGRMTVWPDASAYIPDEPGLNREGAEYLAKCGAIVIGADNLGLEQKPSAREDITHPVHTYLLAEAGLPILEVANLEELSHEKVYEFAFIAACLRIRGATGSPLRPIAMPLRRR